MSVDPLVSSYYFIILWVYRRERLAEAYQDMERLFKGIFTEGELDLM